MSTQKRNEHAPRPAEANRPARMRVEGTDRYKSMVERCFDVRVRTGDEWMAMCPWHENVNTPSLQINISSGDFICFGCGHRGGPVTLARFCGERSDDPAFDLTEMRMRLEMLTKHVGQDPQLQPIDESFLRRYTSIPTDYWTDRGFDPEIIELFELGFDHLENDAIIPLRNRRGELLGVIRRHLDPDADTKYQYPKGFKKTRELFASWLAEETDTNELVLVEGSVDAAMVWQAGFVSMAQYGSRISPEQVRIIKRMGFTRIVLFFDNDKAGREATDAALGSVTRMRRGRAVTEYDPETDLRRHFIVTKVEYRSMWPRDPGGMDNVTIATAVVASTRVS